MSTVCGVRRRRRRYNKIHKAVCEENSLTIALFISLVNLDLFKIIMKVERSINLAYSAVETFPESKIHITNELIHNPMVNDRLHTKNVNFIKKDKDNSKDFSQIKEGDVVMLPAFGATLDEMK